MKLHLAILGCLLAVPLPGQAAASKNYFLVAVEQADGATSTSTAYRLDSAVGAGVVPARAKSTGFTLVGGCPAALEVKTIGRPWLTGALPRFATPKSGVTVTLWGTELNTGPLPTVKIGGQTTAVLSRANHAITVKLPFQPVPGWQPAEVSNTLGTTVLPEAVGILPMVFTEPAPVPDVPMEIVFKGRQNDLVIWAVGAARIPPIPLPSILYGLGLHPAAMIALPGMTITDPSGEFRMPIPPTPYVSPIFLQAVFRTTDPGYAPASFSNVFVL